jgi:hypothetical protein
MAPIVGEIEKITINSSADVWSGGTVTVGGVVVTIPRNLLINLPNDYQTLHQLYDNAPAACRATGETGLAKTDRCNGRATGAQVNIKANITVNGNLIAGQVDVFKALETVNGAITYISYSDGYFRVNGIPNDAATGTMIRVNDPTSRHTIQKGLGCSAGTLNCSPDIRFKVDPDNYTFVYATGYPPCIPTTANGQNDVNCPQTNRPAQPVGPGTSFNNAAVTSPPPVPDSTHFAPIKVGDSVTASGSFETVNGTTFLSAWAVRVQVDLTTKHGDSTQPDYLFINDAEWDGPAYPAGRVRGRILTTATDHQDALNFADIDYFSVHYDPLTNSQHEQILYSVVNNKKQGAVVFGIPNGVYDSQIRMDFFPGAPSLGGDPCIALNAAGAVPNVNIASFCSTGAGTTLDNFNLMVPVFREVMARSRHAVALAAGVTAHDIHGNFAPSGQYKLPTSINYGAFEDINLALFDFPFQFSGTPWLMDRRLSPNGCIPAGQCESSPQPLDPFPFEGYDPRLVSADFGVVVVGGGGKGGAGVSGNTPLPNPDRVLSFWPFGTGLTNPNVLAWPPASPPAIAITPVPESNIFAPVAVNDNAVTDKDTPAPINVISNDVSVLGAIDPASVQIVTPPIHGTLSSIFSGNVTYTPATGYTGPDTFTYKVASSSGVGISGGYSNVATVSVTVVAPPTATNETVTTFTGASQFAINVISNDTPGTYPINPASVNIVSNADCVGGTATLPNPVNGTILFNPPNVAGLCHFSYTVSDSATPPRISNVATVTVTVNPVNTPPVANHDTAFTTFGSTITINVLANDTSTSALDPATVSISGITGGAIVTPNANGTVQYTAPAVVGVGPYTFNYTVKDVTGMQSNSASVVVTLVSPPTASTDSATMAGGAGTSTLIDVLTNDSAAAPATLVPASVAIVGAPTHGSVSVNPADGKVTYYPNPGYVGGDTFTYHVKDNLGVVSNNAIVTITVNAPATESLTVTEAQYIVSSDTWRIYGTSTNHGGTVEAFNNPTAGTSSLGTALVDSDGNWMMTSTGANLPPNAQLQISVQSVTNSAVKLEGIILVVR